jgi:hypothetical protein
MRDRFLRSMVVLCMAGSLAALGGCGEGPPSVDSSKTEATVKGIVKVDGVAVSGGEVIFNPANNQRKDVSARTATIGPDGSYTVKTLTGANEVKIGGAAVKKNTMALRQSRIVEVKSGENTADLDFGGGAGATK